MYKLLFEILPKKHPENLLLAYYKDRFFRIYPLYLFFVLLTILFLLMTNYSNPTFKPLALLYNFTLIPLNYYMYLDSTILQNPSWQLIPPAWSLAAEVQIYLFLAPVMLFYKRALPFIFFVTLFIYNLANLGYLHSDYFGYRLIIGVAFIFITGFYLKKQQLFYPFFVWFFALFSFLFYSFSSNYHFVGFSKETLLGLIIGIPLLYFLQKKQKKLPFDSHFGSFSYALFLSHFLAIFLQKYLYFYPTIVSTLCFSLFFSLIGVIFEKKIRINYYRSI